MRCRPMRTVTEFVQPDWPAPGNVRACTTSRAGGVSAPPYDSFNLASHVKDAEQSVWQNRALLMERLQLPVQPVWLDQVHGTTVLDAAQASDHPQADAAFTGAPATVCAVLTADCLPVLFCDRAGRTVAAAHAGWRGLADGILEATVRAMPVLPENLLAWLGPAIGPDAFEVGDEVRTAFVQHDPEAADAFVVYEPGKWLADLYQLARLRLQAVGVGQVFGGGFCTFRDAARFYSFRREAATGRMASLIWMTG